MMNELLGKSTTKRRSAAKSLQKEKSNNPELESLLIKALEIEKGKNSWQTIVEILKAIEYQNLKGVATTIYNWFILNAEDYSLIAVYAAKIYVKLTMDSEKDVRNVFELLNHEGFSVKCGALDALGYYRMVPDIASQEKLISQNFYFKSPLPGQLPDPRYGLAAACAGWTAPNVVPFLENCMNTDEVPLQYVAQNSLKKKYVKLR